MIFLDSIPLIPLDTLMGDEDDDEIWLYVPHRSWEKESSSPLSRTNDYPAAALNSTITLKETSQWLEDVHTNDILFKDLNIGVEGEEKKQIDTRTFTRPRKPRASPLRPSSIPQSVDGTYVNLNSNVSYSVIQTSDIPCEILNATVVLEDTTQKVTNTEFNMTFQIEHSPGKEELIPPNNNVYCLNTTYPSRKSNQNSQGTSPSNGFLNATYMSEREPNFETSPFHAEHNDVEQAKEPIVDETVFRKPLLPGAIPKRTLIRTSTLNNESHHTPKKEILPSSASGFREIEQAARLQEESLTQTSTPMGQRFSSAFRRTAEMDPHLGSPISNLTDQEFGLNYVAPVPLMEPVIDNCVSSPLLENSHKKIRGQLTFEKSQNSVETQSNSPSSPGDSPYSSQSLESDSAGVLTKEELLRRSMPNLNNPRMRLPQPSVLAGNLNRLHGSESGLRPPTQNAVGHLPTTNTINGSQPRPQLRPPQQHNNLKDVTVSDIKRPNMQRPPATGLQPPTRSSLTPTLSKSKPSQLTAPRSIIQQPVVSANIASPDDLNATKILEKNTLGNTVENRSSSGIPRPQMSRIPAPKTKSSIPTLTFRPRAPQ